ncbi:MAG: hypothetical protein IJR90_01670 [Clostridia bacterium]|nr:hypothetical protein [Clostridia bacterium]
MTNKELLYIKDALGHESEMQKSCTQFANQLQDPDLRNFVNSLAKKHGESYLKFFSLLNS